MSENRILFMSEEQARERLKDLYKIPPEDLLTDYLFKEQEISKLKITEEKYKDSQEYIISFKNEIEDLKDTLKDREEYCNKLEEDRENILIENKKQKEVLDNIKEYCNKQIKIAEENIIESEKWLKVEKWHLQAKQDIHIGKIIKRENEKILELLEEIE